jgi:hypothetical protein
MAAYAVPFVLLRSLAPEQTQGIRRPILFALPLVPVLVLELLLWAVVPRSWLAPLTKFWLWTALTLTMNISVPVPIHAVRAES